MYSKDKLYYKETFFLNYVYSQVSYVLSEQLLLYHMDICAQLVQRSLPIYSLALLLTQTS